MPFSTPAGSSSKRGLRSMSKSRSSPSSSELESSSARRARRCRRRSQPICAARKSARSSNSSGVRFAVPPRRISVAVSAARPGFVRRLAEGAGAHDEDDVDQRQRPVRHDVDDDAVRQLVAELSAASAPRSRAVANVELLGPGRDPVLAAASGARSGVGARSRAAEREHDEQRKDRTLGSNALRAAHSTPPSRGGRELREPLARARSSSPTAGFISAGTCPSAARAARASARAAPESSTRGSARICAEDRRCCIGSAAARRAPAAPPRPRPRPCACRSRRCGSRCVK